jgi:cytidylate kinase
MYGVSYDLKQMIGSLRTSGGTATQESQSKLSQWPFITISRQAGSGGMTLGKRLAERLNRAKSNGNPWQCLDRELVERIAADHHLSTDLIESLERSSHNWITDFFNGMSLRDHNPSEMTVLRRVVETVRAMARAGHVILVGLGAVMITRDIPLGLHVRLIAPLDWRVSNLARSEGISISDARKRVKLLDHDRDAFFHRFWPDAHLSSELFHLTLNAGMMTDDQMSDCLAVLIHKA